MAGPDSFKHGREQASKNVQDVTFSSEVYNRPYMPNLRVDPASTESVAKAAVLIVSRYLSLNIDCDPSLYQVKKVTGGITNALFAVSGFSSNDTHSIVEFNSVLLRVFGAEGMIDRDIETSTFACLCDAGIAPGYLGRFQNGRVESWLDNFSPLGFDELSNPDISRKIAKKMSEVHKFEVNKELLKYHSEPGLWDQLFSWMNQAKVSSFRTENDTSRAKELNLNDIEDQLHYLKDQVVPKNARKAFSHNDLLAANIMKQTVEPFNIQLIDFEYGGCNFVGFDIANHFNEWAGGTDNGKPDYAKVPNPKQRSNFVEAYLSGLSSEGEASAETIESLVNEVNAFTLVNHLYWGLWAINQASTEGCEEFDYLLYASNRFIQYRKEIKSYCKISSTK